MTCYNYIETGVSSLPVAPSVPLRSNANEHKEPRPGARNSFTPRNATAVSQGSAGLRVASNGTLDRIIGVIQGAG